MCKTQLECYKVKHERKEIKQLMGVVEYAESFIIKHLQRWVINVTVTLSCRSAALSCLSSRYISELLSYFRQSDVELWGRVRWCAGKPQWISISCGRELLPGANCYTPDQLRVGCTSSMGQNKKHTKIFQVEARMKYQSVYVVINLASLVLTCWKQLKATPQSPRIHRRCESSIHTAGSGLFTEYIYDLSTSVYKYCLKAAVCFISSLRQAGGTILFFAISLICFS